MIVVLNHRWLYNAPNVLSVLMLLMLRMYLRWMDLKYTYNNAFSKYLIVNEEAVRMLYSSMFCRTNYNSGLAVRKKLRVSDNLVIQFVYYVLQYRIKVP